MSTRGCILLLGGTDESEGKWELDLHEDYQRPDELDVCATTEALRNRFAEFTLNREQAESLYSAIGDWLKRSADPNY